MKQAIAFTLIMLFAVGADGIMEAFDLGGFAVAGVIVMAVAFLLMRSEGMRR